MVQIIENNEQKGFLESILGGLAQSLPPVLNDYTQQRREKAATAKEDAALEALGIPKAAGLSPALKKALLESHFKPAPKAPGGLTGQAVPEEVGKRINEIVNANSESNADQLAQEFDAAGIPPIYSNKYVENRRRKDEKDIDRDIAASTADKKQIHEYHKESAEYDKGLLDSYSRAKRQLEAVNDAIEAIDSGNIKPKSLANIFKGLGPLGDKISNAFLNEDQAKLLASIPQLLEGWKEVFGVRLSDADLKVIEDKLPSIGKDPEANKVFANIIKKYASMNKKKYEISLIERLSFVHVIL